MPASGPPPRRTVYDPFATLTAEIAQRYPAAAVAAWSHLAASLGRTSPKHALRFSTLTRTHLDRTPDVDHALAWDWAQRWVVGTPDVALTYLERYASLAHQLDVTSLGSLASVVERVLTPVPAHAEQFLRLVGSTLALLPAPERRQVLTWCHDIAAASASSVLAFLHHLPELHQRLPGARLQPWIDAGLDLARHNADAGPAYFALESATALDTLMALQQRVAFTHVEPVLRLYTEALHGQHLALASTAALPTGLQMAGRDLPTSDGATIFVPEQVSDFATAADNFAVYKVAIVHQLGFYVCGTFSFALDTCLQHVPSLATALQTLTPAQRAGSALSALFATFEQPDLARRLFTILEDARIDAAMLRQYKGLRRDVARIMAHSLAQRPPWQGLTLRQALLEGVLQRTLGQEMHDGIPPLLRPLLHHLWQRLTPLTAPGATVYDTAAAVQECYTLIITIPLHALASAPPASLADLAEMIDDLPDDADTISLADMFRQAGAGADMLPEGDDPATGLDPVPYRGDAKPELVQQTMRLQDLAEALDRLEQGLNPLSPEALQELLKNQDITIKSLQEGDLTTSAGLFITNLEGRDAVELAPADPQAAVQEAIAAVQADLQATYGDLTAPSQAFLYDEWDYLIHDYRRNWCRLTETTLDDAGLTFVDDTRQRYADLRAQVARQFQLLKPDTYKPLKRLVDGEDIDLDSAIEAFVDRRASHSLPEKVYMRRQRRERSVAALFLLDMSASTDDAIKDPTPPNAPPPPTAPPPRAYDFSGFVQEEHYYTLPPRPPVAAPPKRRIIDLEREALVLMADALEGLGDAYAVYGFSGYGRDQVECFTVKDFAEPYDARVQGRIGAMKPHRSTRMGPAIRHAIHKFAQQDARVKLLLLLSDGYPQDFDYGQDRKSKEYGIQDTTMALHEARLKGIQTFCVTVDPAGHDYLRAMCPDQQYLVLEDMASLPKELPKVYRSLTT